MIEGLYITTAKDDLKLPDSPEYWSKGEIYLAKVESGGVMHLQGELSTTHYTKEGAEKLIEMFCFKELTNYEYINKLSTEELTERISSLKRETEMLVNELHKRYVKNEVI